MANIRGPKAKQNIKIGPKRAAEGVQYGRNLKSVSVRKINPLKSKKVSRPAQGNGQR